MTRDSAVSPVIATILLVAITVIIAAVIAAFIFGMTGDIQKTRIVAVVSDVQNITGTKHITLTNHGGKDIAALNTFRITVDGRSCTPILDRNVGSSVKLNNSVCSGATIGFNARNHLIVVGTFADGHSQILLDTHE